MTIVIVIILITIMIIIIVMVNIDVNIRARSTVDLPVSSNWRKNNLTRELMREDLQIELEALKVSLFESIKLRLCFWRLSSGINSF